MRRVGCTTIWSAHGGGLTTKPPLPPQTLNPLARPWPHPHVHASRFFSLCGALSYLHRDEWQLCDVHADSLCLTNLARKPEHASKLHAMQQALHAWQVSTHDVWAKCNNPAAPGGGGAGAGSGGGSLGGGAWADTHNDVCSF